MRLPLLLLCFQLWSNVRLSLSQNVCPAPPNVPHASVSTETRKDEYKQGDIVHFTCETGYISGPTIRHICSSEGWVHLNQAECYLKPCQLPDDTPNGYYQLIHGDEFVFGTTIKYFCNEGYQMVSREDTRTCLLDKWTNHVPICESLSCLYPPTNTDLTITGLPDNDEPIHPDRYLKFSCDVPGKHLNGTSVLICGKDGKWNHPFPSCEDITCKVGVMPPKLSAVGLSPANETVKVGHVLKFQCDEGFTLDRAEGIQCLETGQWSGPFPTCIDRCRITDLPWGVRITTPRVSVNDIRTGLKLKLGCSIRSHSLFGRSEIECLPNGQWSHPFPTCGIPQDCGRPPTLANADIKHSLRDSYAHNERVEYVCANFYTIQGDPFKTCENGEWTGEMRCRQPCTVDRDAMSKRNIRFKYSRNDKMYSAHGDVIEFWCTKGRHVGGVGMRQTCNEGVMNLPTCH